MMRSKIASIGMVTSCTLCASPCCGHAAFGFCPVMRFDFVATVDLRAQRAEHIDDQADDHQVDTNVEDHRRGEVDVTEERQCHLDVVCLRSEEHTSELQSRFDLVCRLLLE